MVYNTHRNKTFRKAISHLCEGIDFENEIRHNQVLQEKSLNNSKDSSPGTKSKPSNPKHSSPNLVSNRKLGLKDENSNATIERMETCKSDKKILKKVRFNLCEVSSAQHSKLVTDAFETEHTNVTEQIEKETRCFKTWLSMGLNLYDNDADSDTSFPLTQNTHRSSSQMHDDPDLDAYYY